MSETNDEIPLVEHKGCMGVSDVLSRIGDKWTVLVVISLMERPRRFNDLKRRIGGVSQQMLTRTLKALERDGLVSRSVRPTVPPQVEYALTPLGDTLSEPVRLLGDWGFRNLATIHEHRERYDRAADLS